MGFVAFMITLAPLPSWRAIITSVFPRQQDSAQLAAPWMRDGDEQVGWLSRSAWSLALLAHWRIEQKGNGPVSIWIPDYFCDDSLSLLRKIDVRIHFYPVTKKLLPNFPLLREQAKIAPPDILLLVHYFGMPVSASETREFCKREGAWLVEDAAHVLLPSAGIGTEGDFVIYSPHKLLAMPDGALLMVRSKGPSKLCKDFVEILSSTQQWEDQIARLLPTASGGRRLLLWTVKRCLQKLGIGWGSTTGLFDRMTREPIFPPPAMSAFSKALLRQQLHLLPEVALARKRNQLLLDHLFMQSEFKGGVETTAWPEKVDAVPYHAGYCVADAGSWFVRLRSMAMPATTWPDLAAEVRRQPDRHAVALQLRESCFFLPLHQSVRERDLISLFPDTGKHEAGVQILPWQGDRQMWQDLMQQAEFSNLLQSWSYGQCKAHIGGWQVKRLLLLRQGRVVGFAQVLQRCLGKLLCLSRLNRGPIFLPDVGPGTRHAVLRAISNELGNWRLGRILSWAPECRVEGAQLSQLLRTSFRQFSIRGWSSSVLDLKLEEGQLRSGLAGSWRNMLNVAQRNALGVQQLDNDDQAFEVLLANCAQMMQARGILFPAALYRELRKEQATDSHPGLLLAVRHEDQLVAATYVVVHGNTATYLLGWSGELGRKLHAHHLLLWENLMRLKVRNIRYFDLGGIDEERESGIAAFKLGMGGKRYQLAGEGWCC